MLNRLFSFITAATIFGLAWNTFGQASEQGLPRATYEPVGGEASIPYGWVDFCNRHSRRMHPRQAQAAGGAPDTAKLEDAQRHQ